MTELKECPFCGGEARILTDMQDTTTPVFSVVCDGCESITYFGDVLDKERTVEAWNNRPNPWHTGTPTEEGWYLVAYECVYEGRNKGKLEYHTMHILEDEFGHKDIRGRASDDVWKAVAWQKIEPYKEKEDGHTD